MASTPNPAVLRRLLTVSGCGGFAQGLLLFTPIAFVLAVERDLTLSAPKIAFWLNLHLTATVLISIPAGWAIDHWGVRRVGRISLVVMTMGAFGRSFAGTYELLVLTSGVMSAGLITFFICVPKALAVWFPPSRMGLATGVFLGSLGAGGIAGLALSQPLFGDDWQRAFFAVSWAGVVSGGLWWWAAEDREQPASDKLSFDVMKRVLSARTTWTLTGFFSLYLSAFTLWLTYGFPYLVRFRNFEETAAGGALTLTMIGYTIAAIVTPTVSDRVGARRPFLLLFSSLAAAMFACVSLFQAQPLMWAAAFLIGVSFGSINPLVFTLAAEAEELGPTTMGASVGVISSIGSVAGFVVPIGTGRLLGTLRDSTQEAFNTVWLFAIVWALGLLFLALCFREVRLQRTEWS